MANAEATIVIGTSSVIFASLKNMKMIVVDEEYEKTYKRVEPPRYHASNVAVYRAKLYETVCILGSATPSVESLFSISQEIYNLTVLKNRIDGRILPKIEVVDMRYEHALNAKKLLHRGYGN